MTKIGWFQFLKCKDLLIVFVFKKSKYILNKKSQMSARALLLTIN